MEHLVSLSMVILYSAWLRPSGPGINSDDLSSSVLLEDSQHHCNLSRRPSFHDLYSHGIAPDISFSPAVPCTPTQKKTSPSAL